MVFGTFSMISGCVTTAAVPEVRQVTCPGYPPEPPCALPTRESENPLAELFVTTACLRDYIEHYREEWEDCDD